MVKKVKERFRRKDERSIIKNDLILKEYKKQKVYGLTDAQKAARAQKAESFSEEKLILMAEIYNQQNDQVYSVLLRDMPLKKLDVERYQSVCRVMLCGAISKKGKLPLLFIDIEVKINQHYYIRYILQYHLLQHAQNLYAEDYFCVQQDPAPYVLYFLTPQDWPASSPHLGIHVGQH
jgi:hypothetical protein